MARVHVRRHFSDTCRGARDSEDIVWLCGHQAGGLKGTSETGFMNPFEWKNGSNNGSSVVTKMKIKGETAAAPLYFRPIVTVT